MCGALSQQPYQTNTMTDSNLHFRKVSACSIENKLKGEKNGYKEAFWGKGDDKGIREGSGGRVGEVDRLRDFVEADSPRCDHMLGVGNEGR